jgi:hypothetical protein
VGKSTRVQDGRQAADVEVGRSYLLGAAVAGLALLADLADQQGADDIAASFRGAGAVWAAQKNDEEAPLPLRPL